VFQLNAHLVTSWTVRHMGVCPAALVPTSRSKDPWSASNVLATKSHLQKRPPLLNIASKTARPASNVRWMGIVVRSAAPASTRRRTPSSARDVLTAQRRMAKERQASPIVPCLSVSLERTWRKRRKSAPPVQLALIKITSADRCVMYARQISQPPQLAQQMRRNVYRRISARRERTNAIGWRHALICPT